MVTRATRWRTVPEISRPVIFTDQAGRQRAAFVVGHHPDGQRVALAVLTPDLASGVVTMNGRLAAHDPDGAPGTWHWPAYGKSYSDREEVPV